MGNTRRQMGLRRNRRLGHSVKVAIATGDWNDKAKNEDGTPILGGAGWIRLGQYQKDSTLGAVTGELIWNRDERIFGVRSWDLVEHFDCDIIVMQRWMHESIPDRIKEVRKKGQVILNDIDDWYWGLSQQNSAFYDSHSKVNPNENINHYKKTLIRSDGVITSTPYLADRLSSFIPRDRIHILENHVELDKFAPYEHAESEHPVIGWIGSTAHRSGDLDVLKFAYSQNDDKFRYHHSGHVGWFPHFYDEVGMGKDDVTILLPVPPEKLGEQYVFDIGVVPLKNIPFNDAKSWIKGLEYAAAGIPFVASPSEEYVRFKKEYGVGRLAKNGGAWTKHFNELADPRVRAEEAEAALQAIQPLDVAYGAKKWDEIVSSFA